MNTSLVITTINKPNSNIKKFSFNSKKKKWDFIVIGDKKTPKNFKLSYGNYISFKKQKNLKLKFAKICPPNSYARKNIGYLLAIKKNANIIIETDDDNCPKNAFFSEKKVNHKVREINNKTWINIYDLFIKGTGKVWPRGLPLDEITRNKIKIKKKINGKFFLQQGVCEQNPDVDAIYRLLNKKINIKFRNNYKVSLGYSFSPFNSQNTIWFKAIFPLLYLPVTCSMRCTDIWRGLIALNILQNDSKKILFFGTTMYQNRNYHDLIKDLNQEMPLYVDNKKIYEILRNLKMKKGEKNYVKNLILSYKTLIKNKIISKSELSYLYSWIHDLY